ncbi:MAG TPA: response regulator [Acidobacteriaceae bacterium]|nr:response regulator [Acidobacteriaceae bacterium]
MFLQLRSRSVLAVDDSEKIPPPLAEPAENGMDQAPRRARVLVVDDQRLIADTVAEILTNAGFEAVAAYDGWQAVEIASRFRPNWLLSDVLMPRMNGVELAITLRQKDPRMAILLFSGQAGISEILLEGQRRGYEFELIAKPIHPLKLIERLKQE